MRPLCSVGKMSARVSTEAGYKVSDGHNHAKDARKGGVAGSGWDSHHPRSAGEKS